MNITETSKSKPFRFIVHITFDDDQADSERMEGAQYLMDAMAIAKESLCEKGVVSVLIERKDQDMPSNLV